MDLFTDKEEVKEKMKIRRLIDTIKVMDYNVRNEIIEGLSTGKYEIYLIETHSLTGPSTTEIKVFVIEEVADNGKTNR